MLNRYFGYVVLVLILSSACQRQGGDPSAASVADAPGRDRVSRETLLVSLVPEAPTVVSTLQAVYNTQGEPVVCRWSLNGAVIDGEESSSLSPRGRFSRGDSVSVIISSGGRSGAASVFITNSPPVIQSIMLNPNAIYRGVDIQIVPKGYDADDDNIRYTYTWKVNEAELAIDSPVLSGDLFKRGDVITVTVVPSDNESAGSPYVGKSIVILNAPPHFVSFPPVDFQGKVYNYTAVAVDPDGDRLTYTLRNGPAGMSIDASSGEVSLSINKTHQGVHTVEIEASDSQGLKAIQKYALTLTIP